MGFLSILSFLGLAALSPVLAYAYLKKPPSEASVISTSFILNQIVAKPVSKKSIKLPLRFYLELLALLLLALCIGAPYLDMSQKRVAILIDNSFSMGALDSEQSRSRLEQAKELAKGIVDSNAFSSRFDIVSTSSGIIAENLAESTTARSSITSLEVQDSSDRLFSQLVFLGEQGIYDKIYSFSDKAVTLDGNELSKLYEHKLVGERVVNAYLKNLALSQDRKSLFIELGLSSPTPLNLRLGAKLLSLGSNEKKIDLANKERRLLAYSTQTETIPLEGYVKVNEKFQIEVSLLDSTGALLSDAIILDNQASISSIEEARSQIAIISPLKKKLGLEKIQKYAFKELSTDSFKELAPEEVENFDAFLFYHSNPETLPSKSSLFILPPANFNFISRLQENKESLNISSWQNEHPLTRYLKPQLLKPTTATVLFPDYWATPIISSELGPLIIAGEKEGKRFAGVGFELLPFEGRRTPTSSVLLLNLLSWLTEVEGSNKKSADSGLFYEEAEADSFKLYSESISKQDFSEQVTANNKSDDRVELWPYLLTAALFIIFLESLLLIRLGRERNQETAVGGVN